MNKDVWRRRLLCPLFAYLSIIYVSQMSSVSLTLKVLVTTIDAQWEGMGDVGSAGYEPALLPPCPTIRVLATVSSKFLEIQHFKGQCKTRNCVSPYMMLTSMMMIMTTVVIHTKCVQMLTLGYLIALKVNLVNTELCVCVMVCVCVCVCERERERERQRWVQMYSYSNVLVLMSTFRVLSTRTRVLSSNCHKYSY